MNRRSVLGLLGSVPVVGPTLAAKLQHEKLSGELSGLQTDGLSYGTGAPSPPDEYSVAALRQKRAAMQLPWIREVVEASMRDQTRYVGTLDPDLAILKSVSLSAKICYQRERNVQRAISEYGREPSWLTLQSLWQKISSFGG
mgnify:FL=1